MKKALTLTFLLIITGCTTVIRANQSGATSEGVRSVVESNNKFAIDFYQGIKEANENILFSPYSLSTALGMVYEGAGGETKQEMKKVLYVMDNDSLRRPSTGMVYNLINTPRAKYDISTANALWMQEDFSIKKDYLRVIKDYYVGEATNLDFKDEPEESRTIINDWVEAHTNNKIKDLIPAGALGPLTRLLLTNAVHFKGYWLYQFDKAETVEEEFYTGSQTVNVPMMRLTSDELEFNYTEDANAEVIELAYDGGDLSMLIVLPKKSLSVVEEGLNTSKIIEWRENLTPKTVHVYLPRFTFETKYFLKNNLAAMGMPTAFTTDADLSGISDEQLTIDEVIHQAFIEVNEEGTEAAAATAVIIKITALPDAKIFRADHPFIFLIQERGTGAIVFMGRVINPQVS